MITTNTIEVIAYDFTPHQEGWLRAILETDFYERFPCFDLTVRREGHMACIRVVVTTHRFTQTAHGTILQTLVTLSYRMIPNGK